MKRFRRWLFNGLAAISRYALAFVVLAIGVAFVVRQELEAKSYDPNFTVGELVIDGLSTLAMPVLPAVALSFILVWYRRTKLADYRKTHELCVKCGYDLRATPDRCPECGTIPIKENSK